MSNSYGEIRENVNQVKLPNSSEIAEINSCSVGYNAASLFIQVVHTIKNSSTKSVQGQINFSMQSSNKKIQPTLFIQEAAHRASARSWGSDKGGARLWGSEKGGSKGRKLQCYTPGLPRSQNLMHHKRLYHRSECHR